MTIHVPARLTRRSPIPEARALTAAALAVASLGGIVPASILVAGQDAAAPGENDLSGFSARDVSPTELEVTIEYTFAAEPANGSPDLSVCALQADGRQVPGTACEHVPIDVGSGRTSASIVWDARFDAEGKASYQSTSIRACLHIMFDEIIEGERGQEIQCEDFAFAKTWAVAPAPADGEPSPDAPATEPQPEPGDAVPPAPERPPSINLFSASPLRVVAGREVRLRWRTSHAEQAWIVPHSWDGSGMVSKPDNTVPPTGEMRLKPSKNTTYTLIARNRIDEVVKRVDVRVTPPASPFCEISGKIKGDEKSYATRANLYPVGSKTAAYSVAASGGAYLLRNVKEGRYRLALTGKYPNDRLSIGPKPQFRDLTCLPGQRHHSDFSIVSWEG